MSGAPLTIGRLARRHGLSRSTLLYYDRIGLLHPSGRSAAGYRHYTPGDVRRLEQICLYRETGLPLAEIARLLSAAGTGIAAVLEKRLAELDGEIRRLRSQQEVILRMLQADPRSRPTGRLDKAGWVALLRAAGLDEAGMRLWHREFEQRFPRSHHEFLEGLGLPEREIQAIRRWSRTPV